MGNEGWTRDESRGLFTIILELNAKGNTTGIDWSRVQPVFNRKFRTKEVKQMKNHHQQCRKKWRACQELQEMSGIAFGDNKLPTQEEMRSERMREFIAKYGSEGKMVTKEPLQDLDLWNPVFRGSSATGDYSFSPALTRRMKGKDDIVYDDTDVFRDTNNSNETPLEKEFETQESVSPSHTTSSKKRKSDQSSSKSSEFKKAFHMLKVSEKTPQEKLIDAVTSMPEVQARGSRFRSQAILYLVDKGLDKHFIYLAEEDKWEWISHLPYD